jgi:hypothetical protein
MVVKGITAKAGAAGGRLSAFCPLFCMRVKDVFSVFPRKLKSGKVVFYYQCYDENGNCSSGLSTGQVTKTKEKRNIPLALMIINEPRQLASENNNGYVFSPDGGESPVSRKLMYNKALQAIGMTQQEIKRRGLSIGPATPNGLPGDSGRR